MAAAVNGEMTPLVKRIIVIASVIGILAGWALTIEGYFVRQRTYIDPRRAAVVAGQAEASWEDVAITAADGVRLKGWMFVPERGNGRAVLLVHGGGVSRLHMLTRTSWLLKAGYACLAIDLRGCGASGGTITWGVREPDDLVRWAQWLRARTRAATVFGFGTSRGSTTLIQSLGLGIPLDGIALEAAGVGNIGRPYEFIGDRLGLSEQTAHLFAPFIEPTFAWVRFRYAINLRHVRRGVDSVRMNRTPLLILQGADDELTPLRRARRLVAAAPDHIELVVIPKATHDWFVAVRPEVMEKVTAWFERRAVAQAGSPVWR